MSPPSLTHPLPPLSMPSAVPLPPAPPPAVPWHPPSEPNSNTTVNGRRLEAASRHRPSGVALPPFAQIPTIQLSQAPTSNRANRGGSTSVTRRIGTSTARKTFKYLVILHPEPARTFFLV
jgi:hypothetical protein